MLIKYSRLCSFILSLNIYLSNSALIVTLENSTISPPMTVQEPNQKQNVKNITNLVLHEVVTPSKRYLTDSEDTEYESQHSSWLYILQEAKEMTRSKQMCYDWKSSCNVTLPEKMRKLGPSSDRELCDCDASCENYGDCCIDVASKKSTLDSFKTFEVNSMKSCESLERKFLQQHFTSPQQSFCPTKGVLMISTCTKAYSGSVDEKFCLQDVPSKSYSYVLDIPVVSLVTNHTYKNYYCSLCNNDAENLLEPSFSVSCVIPIEKTNSSLTELLSPTNYESGTGVWKSYGPNNAPEIENVCFFKIEEYQNMNRFLESYNGRQCYFPNCPSSSSHQVRQCNVSWPDSSDTFKCLSYSWYVLDESTGIVYKNPHCAKCNFVNTSLDNLSCRVSVIQMRRGILLRPSFSVLFDLNLRHLKRCLADGEIWDPIHSKCNQIVCPPQYILKEEKCISEQQTTNSSPVNLLKADSSCARIPLQPGEFIYFDNGSIHSVLNDRIYDNEEYFIINGSVALVCVVHKSYYDQFKELHSTITLVVLTISLVCLFLHVILYFLSKPKTFHGRNLLCLCLALFIAQFLLLFSTTFVSNYAICLSISVLLHYFWLVSFFWMNVLSLDVWRTFRSKLTHSSINTNKIFLKYNLYAWGVPLLIVALALILDVTKKCPKIRPGYVTMHERPKLCWITNKMGLVVFFLLPLGLIVFENCLLFVLTSIKIIKQTRECQYVNKKSQSIRRINREGNDDRKKENVHHRNKIRFALYLKLGILQGLTWVTGFMSCFLDSSLSWLFFTIINGLQGAAIFVSFDLKNKVFQSFWEKFIKRSRQSVKYLTKETKSSSLQVNKNSTSNNESSESPEKDAINVAEAKNQEEERTPKGQRVKMVTLDKFRSSQSNFDGEPIVIIKTTQFDDSTTQPKAD